MSKISKCVKVTKNNFNKIIENDVVFVEFWAPWASPCRKIDHIIEELAEDFDRKATIAKVNTDDLHDLAIKFKIRFVPTVIVFKNGKEISRRQGEASKESFSEIINDAINL